MENITAATVWAWLLAAASALVLLSNAAEKIVKAVKAAKAPNAAQNERLDALEAWQKDAAGKLNRDNDRLDALEAWQKDAAGKLNRDNERLEAIEEGNRASQRALLALLDHGIDGNNVKQMQDAKEQLQNHLINR